MYFNLILGCMRKIKSLYEHVTIISGYCVNWLFGGGRYKSVSHWVWACHIRSLMAPNGGSYRDNVLQSHQRVQLGIRFAGDVLMQYCGRYHSCQENSLIYLSSRVRDWSLFESWSSFCIPVGRNLARPYGSRLGPKIVWSMIEWTCLLWGSQLLVFRGSCWLYWQQHRFCRMQPGYCFHSMPVSSGSFEVFHVGEKYVKIPAISTNAAQHQACWWNIMKYLRCFIVAMTLIGCIIVN